VICCFSENRVSLTRFLNKRILVVVAHQDDEALYFGGLLSTIAGRADISLMSTTAPMPGRTDTNHRVANFQRVGVILGCRDVTCLNLPDCGPRGEASPPDQLARAIETELRLRHGRYDLVLTHNMRGEPNPVYGNTGHEAHKATSRAVRAAMLCPIVYCGRGVPDIAFRVEYEPPRKKVLIDCYAPYWTPVDYPFAYESEPYSEAA
jgi:LmbE family N-acetylglucosaminyl deacetylase